MSGGEGPALSGSTALTAGAVEGPALSAVEGFTLIEMMIVIIIIGILVGIAIPQFAKTLETSKATDAAAQLQLIAAANRMFALDHVVSGIQRYASSELTTTCNGYDTPWCTANCQGTTPSGCCLVACKYLATADWSAKPYTFYAASAGCPVALSLSACSAAAFDSSNLVSCALRKTGDAPGTDTLYNTWGYGIDRKGVAGCTAGDVSVGPPPPPPS